METKRDETRRDEITLKDFLERVIDERDRLYDTRFNESKTAVNAALAAHEKQTAASFAASEKAIIKAEEAQREYNIRSNEFRGQLDDQAKLLMPRSESSALFTAVENRIDAVRDEMDRRLNAAVDDVASLRESRSAGAGGRLSQQIIWGYIFAAIAAVGGILAVFMMFRK